MFISRLTLRRDPGALGAVVGLLSDGLDPGRAHRLLWSLFGDQGDRRRDFLFRAGRGAGSPDGDFLVVSARVPEDRLGLWHIETKPYDPCFTTGQPLAFSLRANPTVDREGRRHDVVMDRKRALGAERETPNAEIWATAGRDWLAARASRLGLALEDCRADGYRVHRFPRGEGGRLVSVAMLDLSGAVRVTEADRLRAALFAGVGRGKAWGCGLLLVRSR